MGKFAWLPTNRINGWASVGVGWHSMASFISAATAKEIKIILN
jgi:hypothetical protein